MLLKKDLKDIGYIISYESDNRGKMAFLGEYHLIGLVVGLSTFLSYVKELHLPMLLMQLS